MVIKILTFHSVYRYPSDLNPQINLFSITQIWLQHVIAYETSEVIKNVFGQLDQLRVKELSTVRSTCWLYNFQNPFHSSEQTPFVKKHH